MRPAARVAAAIDVLDAVRAGAPAEKTLTTWARQHRFAGAKDRAAVRDHVFDALRCRRSFAALGGAETGRGLMLGALRAAGRDPEAIFSGARFAPAPLGPGERAAPAAELDRNVACDVPDWLAPRLVASLGADFAAVTACLRWRAPVFLRVNRLRATMRDAAERLAEERIVVQPHPLSPTALEVMEGGRRVRAARSFAEGAVELQDAASQAVADAMPLTPGARVLDFCAGGGGKALALAARGAGEVVAHDARPERMRDLPVRAARAGAPVTPLGAGARPGGRFDLVLCDVPCSGTGAWRRDPEAKWRLDAAELARLAALQDAVLDAAAPFVAPQGALGYATCSLLEEENRARVAAFLRRRSGWRLGTERRFSPLAGGDGFYAAVLIPPPAPA